MCDLSSNLPQMILFMFLALLRICSLNLANLSHPWVYLSVLIYSIESTWVGPLFDWKSILSIVLNLCTLPPRIKVFGCWLYSIELIFDVSLFVVIYFLVVLILSWNFTIVGSFRFHNTVCRWGTFTYYFWLISIRFWSLEYLFTFIFYSVKSVLIAFCNRQFCP